MKKLFLPFLLLCVTFCKAQQKNDTHACFNDLANIIKVSSAKVTASSVAKYATTPVVVPVNSTVAVLLEVTVTGSPSSVQLELNSNKVVLNLTDDGKNGDKKAADGIYTISLTSTSGWQSFIGYVRVYDNGVQVVQINAFIMVLTTNMPQVNVRKIDNNTQFSNYVYNVKLANSASTEASLNAIAKDFYKYHFDEFDFINFILIPGFLDNRHHVTISNDIQGIGLNLANISANFGSKERLKGYNWFPIPSLFDPATNGYNHEIGHQWINYLSTTILKSGSPHWPFSNLATGIMGFSLPGGVGGTFPKIFTETSTGYTISTNSATAPPAFNDWEMYLIGLLPASEVKIPAISFKDQSVAPADGAYAKTAFDILTIDDLIKIVGERKPSFEDSQKQFSIATIVISESLLNNSEMAYFDFMARRAEAKNTVQAQEGLVTYTGKPFYVATRNKATLRGVLNTNFNCATIPAKPTIVTANAITSVCSGADLILDGTTTGATTYTWFLNGSPISDTSPMISVSSEGNYSVSARSSVACNSEISNAVKVTVAQSPTKPIITFENSSLKSSIADNYQWLLNGTEIKGETNQTLKTFTAGGVYSVKVSNTTGCSIISEVFSITAIENNDLPNEVTLLQNSPNPFEQKTQIKFGLPKPQQISLKLYDNTGKSISILAEGQFTEGWHFVNLEVKDLSSGVYVYRLDSESGNRVEKLLVVN